MEDRQVVKLILAFLDSRKLHNTMRSLEKEAGIVNCSLSDDILFLRDLVLDGEWEAILIFAQQFEVIDSFDSKRFRYIVLKQKFMEVLYFKSGFGGNSTSYSIEDLIKCLNQLEEDCPNKSDYSKLCWLLSVPNLPEQPECRDWSPATAQLKCFEQLLGLLKRVIPIEKKGLNGKIPKTISPVNDRLLHLLFKGLCFESCVDYCQLRAINGVLSEDIRVYTGDHILHGPSQESSGNFLSWLQNLSQEAFITPFEPANVEVDSKKSQASLWCSVSQLSLPDEMLKFFQEAYLLLEGLLRQILLHMWLHLKNANAILNNRPHSAQPAKEVSHSYDGFQYKSGSKREPSSKVVSNGFNEHATIIDQENKERLSAQVHILDNNLHNIDQDHHYTPVGENNYATELSKDSKEIHSLKEQQQQDVLKQLEAHEKQKLELERRLMELSFRGINHGKPDGEELGQDDLQDERPMSMKSLKNFKSENVSHGSDICPKP